MKEKTTQEYFDSMHRLGRIASLIAVFIMFGIPTIVCIVNGVLPSFGDVLKASYGLLAIFIPIGISEIASYTPILGTSMYITFITGNIANLKLPAVLSAMDLTDSEQGTEKGDIVSGIAVAVSSLITVTVIIIGVLLLAPLQPVLETQAVATASHYVLPALFGCLALFLLGGNAGGGIKIKGKLLGAIIPLVLVTAVFFVMPELLTQLQGVFIIISIPIVWFSSKFLYKKGIIKVSLPGDENGEDLSAEAAE